MKTNMLFLMLICSIYGFAQGQYFTKTGYINFYSHAPLEDITADNRQVAAFLDMETGMVNFAALIKSFEFEKALMQEHFNENYMESDKYPKATFQGEVQNFSELSFKDDVPIKVQVKGNISIHGITKALTASALLEKKNNAIMAECVFMLRGEDFKIKIPKATRDNISEEIKVTVKVELKPLKR